LIKSGNEPISHDRARNGTDSQFIRQQGVNRKSIRLSDSASSHIKTPSLLVRKKVKANPASEYTVRT